MIIEISCEEYIEDNCPECERNLKKSEEQIYGSYYVMQRKATCKCGWWNYDFLYEDVNGDSDEGITMLGRGLDKIPWVEDFSKVFGLHPILR